MFTKRKAASKCHMKNKMGGVRNKKRMVWGGRINIDVQLKEYAFWLNGF